MPTFRRSTHSASAFYTCLLLVPLAAGACGQGQIGESTHELDAVEVVPQAGTTPTPVLANKELFVTDLSVVTDPKYVKFTKISETSTSNAGAWSFGRLVENIAATRNSSSVSQFVLNWLKLWEVDQTVNAQTVLGRPTVRTLIIDPWKVSSGCTGMDSACVLDMSRAPFRLEAIAYRPDLRRVPTSTSPGHAGQGRFVFSALGPSGAVLPFSVIFEYLLPISERAGILQWANAYHLLGRLPLGSIYNASLAWLTQKFSGRGAMTGRPNASALSQLRSNENALSPVWELREFVIAADGKMLFQDTVKNEPAAVHNGTALLGEYVDEFEASVLNDTASIPDTYKGVPFLAGSALVPFRLLWNVRGTNSAANKRLALSTCSGCHLSETATLFLHVMPAEVRAKLSRLPPPTVRTPAVLSAFLQSELSGPRILDYQVLLATPLPSIQDGPGKDHADDADDDDDDD